MTEDKILEMVTSQKDKARHVFDQITKEVDTYKVGHSNQDILTRDFIEEAVSGLEGTNPKAADLILALAWTHAHEAGVTAMLAKAGFQKKEGNRRSKGDIEARIREAEDEIALSRSYGGPDPDPGRIARLEHEIDVLRWALNQKDR